MICSEGYIFLSNVFALRYSKSHLSDSQIAMVSLSRSCAFDYPNGRKQGLLNLIKHSSSVSCAHKDIINPKRIGQFECSLCTVIWFCCAIHPIAVLSGLFSFYSLTCMHAFEDRFEALSPYRQEGGAVCFFNITQPCFQIQHNSQSGLNLYFSVLSRPNSAIENCWGI